MAMEQDEQQQSGDDAAVRRDDSGSATGDRDARASTAAASAPLPTTAAPSSAVASTTTATATSAMGMFFGMDSVHGDDAINIIEDGDHVSADDFGLSSAEISMSSVAASTSDMSHMSHMNMELNALQIQAFLARAERDANSALLPTASAPTPVATNAYDASRGVVYYSRREDKMKALREHPVVDAVSPDGREVACKCGRIVRLNPPWYILKFEQHIVSRNCTFLRSKTGGATSRGTKATAASRQTPRGTSVKRARPVVPTNAVAAAPPVVSDASVSDSDARVNEQQTAAVAEDHPMASGPVADATQRIVHRIRDGGESDAAVRSPPQSADQDKASASAAVAAESMRPTTAQSEPTDYALLSLQDALASVFVFASDGMIEPRAMQAMATAADTADSDASLKRKQFDAAVVLQSEPHFSRVTPDGRFIECSCAKLVALAAPWDISRFLAHVTEKQAPAKTPKRPSTARVRERQKQAAAAAAATGPGRLGLRMRSDSASMRGKKKSFPSEVHWDAALARNLLPCPGLRDDKMRLVVESAVHLTGGARPRHKIAHELFPGLCPAPSPSSTAPSSVASTPLARSTPSSPKANDVAKREEAETAGADTSAAPMEVADPAPETAATAPTDCESAAAAATSTDPAPVETATESPSTTAPEDEPTPTAVSSQAQPPRASERAKVAYKLSPEQKLLLHDAIEAESLWFIDKDGMSVRSLDCRGIIDVSKGESVCASCHALRSNASLRTAATFTAKRAKTQRNPLNRKFCSRRVFSALEAEFDMDEEYARILRDLSLADLPDDSALNLWLDMAEMGLHGAFESHAAFLGLIECMVALKDKERRGVGMQNMYYSDHLDAFMRAVADVSPDACELFQQHLCGRKPRALQLGRKRKSASMLSHVSGNGAGSESSQHHDERARGTGATPLDEAQSHASQHHHMLYDTAGGLGHADGLANLLDASTSALMPSLSMHDIHDVDLSSFTTSTGPGDDLERPDHEFLPPPQQQQAQQLDEALQDERSSRSASSSTAESSGRAPAADGQATVTATDEDGDGSDNDSGDGGDASPASAAPALTSSLDHAAMVPCTGLRDDKVEPFVKMAVQVIGGSRPKYVIAKELFPHVFSHEKTVKIAQRLDDEQKRMLQDAVFSECLWRVDKAGRCVRSLRCHRYAERKTRGVCRACRDLKAVPNFRSVLSRAKAPKVLDNVKYLPTALTESDPFLRKLAKNASFRALYQRVKVVATASASDGAAARRKAAVFWLKCARMGVFGRFRSHPVFEGLVESMVEIQDKARRGVGKQNMQYSKALDEFMNAFAATSMDAFDLFAAHFCGRTLRSQKVKKRKAMATTLATGYASVAPAPQTSPSFHAAVDASASDLSHALQTNMLDVQQHAHHAHHHHLLATDELLSGRQLTVSDLEENQRFMDRMLDEVRLSVSHDIQLHEEMMLRQQSHHRSDSSGGDTGAALEPRTYLDDQGVLTTEI